MATKRLSPITPVVSVGEGGTGIATATAAGGVVYTASTVAYGTTAAGVAGQALISNGIGAPGWKNTTPIHVAANASPPGTPATNDLWLVTDQGADLTAPTDGGIVYGDGSNYQVTAAGTTGQVLTSAGTDSPTWVTSPVVITAGGTTDASGFITITHGLGFTPSSVMGQAITPASSFAVVWGIDSLAATTFRARFFHSGGTGNYVSASVGTIRYWCYQ